MEEKKPLVIHHNCFVVSDIVEALEYIKDTYCVNEVKTWDFKPNTLKINGEPYEGDFMLKIAMCTTDGEASVELIQPVSQIGCHYDHLAAGLLGVHHVGYTTEAYDYWYKHFESKGVTYVFEAEIEDDVIGYRRCCYAKDEKLGYIFEIREVPYFRNK